MVFQSSLSPQVVHYIDWYTATKWKTHSKVKVGILVDTVIKVFHRFNFQRSALFQSVRHYLIKIHPGTYLLWKERRNTDGGNVDVNDKESNAAKILMNMKVCLGVLCTCTYVKHIPQYNNDVYSNFFR